ncbi:hypothetical protein DICVIV_11757 [Dictyocaulus viviparus]|uniref:Uncharacterized protein n=1 Tax=Dictyocaulus viviparus TaxID=29172 RepID=A0A0D8XIW5_DICVI|nr:hypothetical protein DICVIV_11757 [Dictyocaulus viviparus]
MDKRTIKEEESQRQSPESSGSECSSCYTSPFDGKIHCRFDSYQLSSQLNREANFSSDSTSSVENTSSTNSTASFGDVEEHLAIDQRSQSPLELATFVSATIIFPTQEYGPRTEESCSSTLTVAPMMQLTPSGLLDENRNILDTSFFNIENSHPFSFTTLSPSSSIALQCTSNGSQQFGVPPSAVLRCPSRDRDARSPDTSPELNGEDRVFGKFFVELNSLRKRAPIPVINYSANNSEESVQLASTRNESMSAQVNALHQFQPSGYARRSWSPPSEIVSLLAKKFILRQRNRNRSLLLRTSESDSTTSESNYSDGDAFCDCETSSPEPDDEQNAGNVGGEGYGNVNANFGGMFPHLVWPITNEIDEMSLEEDDTQASSISTSRSFESLDSGFNESGAMI